MADKTRTQEAIARFLEREDTSAEDMYGVISEIMEGGSSDAQIAAFLVALRMKVESVDEITGAVRAMRDHARSLGLDGQVDGPLFDTCGTGGDGAGTFNISTATAFVVAGAGIPVAKHGNRSISSRCGSADVLEELGVNCSMPVESTAEAVRKLGIGFMFAPLYHGAMKHAAVPRREIGVRSIFNIMGPLSNPAGATHQLLGVYDRALAEPLAHVLQNLGTRGAMVVHGADGLDELTLTGPTHVAELRDGKISVYDFDPRDVGLEWVSLDDIRGGDAAENAAHIRAVLSGTPSAMAELTVLNAAAALRTCGRSDTWEEAIAQTRSVIASGAALAKLDELVSFSRSLPA